MNTKKLTCLAIIVSFWCLALVFESYGMPITCIFLAIFIPILGWKNILIIRLALTSLTLIVRFETIVYFFSMNTSFGIGSIFGIYLGHFFLLFMVNQALRRIKIGI